jgi:hypothetical protein
MSEEEEKKKNAHILDGMNLEEAIFRCGELQASFEETALLLSGKMDPKLLVKLLQTPGTEPHEAYHKGMAEGNLSLDATLVANVENPKAKDAYKFLSAERRRQAINEKLHELFEL